MGGRSGVEPLNERRSLLALSPLKRPRSASQLPSKVYFDRKLAEGKTKKDAIRSLKRHISNAVYRRLLSDADRSNR
jgi:transposase